MNSITVAEKSHSELGASVAARWIACPGSVRLSRGRENQSSEFAQEGTAAHALGELCLRRGVDPDTYIGMTLEGVEVTDEMAEHVRMYVEHCRALAAGTINWVEKKFSLASLLPPSPMYGTADFVALHPPTRTLHVVDLKYGQGVVVEAKGNKQLRYYALGALLSLDAEERAAVDDVVITIIQPRAQHADGPIRTEVVSVVELIDFSIELMDAAKRTQEPDAPLVAGPHCRFCPASAICPAQRDHAASLAQIEFGTVDVPPEPEGLPNELLAEIAAKLPVLDQWSKDIRKEIFARISRGETVPGFKLVAKKNRRFWIDENETEQYLRADGRETEEIFDLKLKSPAQIEKLVGKKNLPKDLIGSKSTGVTIAPEHDRRPVAVLNAGDEFFALESGDE